MNLFKKGGSDSYSVQGYGISRQMHLIPHKSASFGIISDVDETILQTGVKSIFRWKLILNAFFSHKRKKKRFLLKSMRILSDFIKRHRQAQAFIAGSNYKRI